jgi:hypothetical protein
MCPLHSSRKSCCFLHTRATLRNAATGGDILGRSVDEGRPLKPKVDLASVARVPEDEAHGTQQETREMQSAMGNRFPR